MKNTIFYTALLLLTLLLCATGVLAEPAVGGWENVPHEAAKLPAEAQTAFDSATKGLDGYVPVELLSTQAAEGTNYCVLCQITSTAPEAASGWALVYIHADPKGDAEITNVYELYIDRHSTPAK